MLSLFKLPFRAKVARPTIHTINRSFHAIPVASESVGEKVRELGQKVNLKVGKGLASAIEQGEKMTYATKEKLEGAQHEAEETKDSLKEKAQDAGKHASKAKEEVKEELKK